jgi:serine/threonine protein kinase
MQNGAWTFADRFELISDTARDFISKLLVYDFKDRFDVTAALKHRWFDMLLKEPVDLPNILRDSHSSYYYKLK